MWLLLVAALSRVALAGVAEDVATAADRDQPTALRQAAFDRVAVPDSVKALQHLADDDATSPPQRWVAIRALGPIAGDEARIALLHFLAATEASSRIAALGGLGDRGDLSLSDRVAARLTDPALLVRAAAGQALGKLKDPRTLPDLARALNDPTNRYRGTSLWFRRIFVESMAAIGSESVPYLARVLDDDDAEVARAAKTGLEKIAGFSYSEGRSPEQEREAWRRWAGAGK